MRTAGIVAIIAVIGIAPFDSRDGSIGPVVLAQGRSGRPAALPRTPDGRPDLQGNWTNATITPLERMRPNTPLVLTEAAALDEENKTRAALEAREAPSDPNRSA